MERQFAAGGSGLRLWLGREPGRVAGPVIGFGLLKPLGSGQWELGLMLVGEHQRSSLAVRLGAALMWIALERLAAQTLVSYAHPEHRLALHLNRGCGFLPAESDKPGELCFRTPAAQARCLPVYRRMLARMPADWCDPDGAPL